MRWLPLIVAIFALGSVATLPLDSHAKAYSAAPQLSAHQDCSGLSSLAPVSHGATVMASAASFSGVAPALFDLPVDFPMVPFLSDGIRAFAASGLSPPPFT